jgi:hypothetical protein
MNSNRIKIVLTIISVLCPLITYAGGSSYSRYGFGDILRYGDSRIYAMGGTGIALIDNGIINLLNPAGMSRINFTRFSTGFEYTRFSSKDETGSSFYSMGGFHGLAIAIPLSQENGIVMSMEATPYSKVSYAIQSTIPDNVTGLSEKIVSYGSGGLSYLGLGLSASPLNSLHIGGRLNYMYGRTRQYQAFSYNNSDYASNTFDRCIYYSGFTFTFGAIYEGLDQLLNAPSLHNLSVGLTLRTSSSLNADAERYYSTIDTTIQKGSADLPFSTGLGLSYLHNNRYRFLGDFVFENWGNLKTFAFEQVSLRNSYRTSIGFEAIPEKGADKFLKRIFYRAGFVYNSTYYKINGVGINELLLCGGFGFPIGYESWLNIGFQVGSRGTTDNKLQKDIIVRFSVAVSASELWFLKFDEE